jgi:hypothetical protein
VELDQQRGQSRLPGSRTRDRARLPIVLSLEYLGPVSLRALVIRAVAPRGHWTDRHDAWARSGRLGRDPCQQIRWVVGLDGSHYRRGRCPIDELCTPSRQRFSSRLTRGTLQDQLRQKGLTALRRASPHWRPTLPRLLPRASSFTSVSSPHAASPASNLILRHAAERATLSCSQHPFGPVGGVFGWQPSPCVAILRVTQRPIKLWDQVEFWTSRYSSETSTLNSSPHVDVGSTFSALPYPDACLEMVRPPGQRVAPGSSVGGR